MVSSFSGLRATRYRWAWFLAKCLAVSWAMEEVAPIIIIFWVFMVAFLSFLNIKKVSFLLRLLAAAGGQLYLKEIFWGHPRPRQRTSSSALLFFLLQAANKR